MRSICTSQVGSWARIPIEARMSAYTLFRLTCVGSGLAIGWSPIQRALPTGYKIPTFRVYYFWMATAQTAWSIEIKGINCKQVRDTISRASQGFCTFLGVTPCSPLKVNRLRCIISQTIELFTSTAVRTPNPRYLTSDCIKPYNMLYSISQSLRTFKIPFSE